MLSQTRVISDAECAQILTPAIALDAMRRLFIELATGEADNFHVIRERPGIGDCVWGVKAGVSRPQELLGLKIGGYWPNNPALGLARHQSTIVLSDPHTGRCAALVGGNIITALRTAASSALAIDLLARKDAATLGVIGAGGQALWHVEAALAARRFERVLVANRSLPAAEALARRISAPVEVATAPDELVSRADVVITITGSTTPLFDPASVRPGTHFSCMGSDTRGKQEVPAALLARARLFTDSIDQSLTLGEGQHGATAEALTLLGAVAAGRAAGRIEAGDITLYDGTGLGLQDLVMARLALDLAADAGLGVDVDF
ncbi:ornithine cyclodeaminase family protein [Caulobacter segnis]|uniref:ornithine cyclodeaminase family protein n=1 Tax=Caulobacter segnis TaxID=88688 RepID=UPI00240F46C8|nr:ornithine cyclodeaminase family protein [Caulobacter segnis]MDG2521221.1 ornithine cyclodeaminase family protein [Caulobacter segnis]